MHWNHWLSLRSAWDVQDAVAAWTTGEVGVAQRVTVNQWRRMMLRPGECGCRATRKRFAKSERGGRAPRRRVRMSPMRHQVADAWPANPPSWRLLDLGLGHKGSPTSSHKSVATTELSDQAVPVPR